jgi:hypothetical protein
VPPVVHTHPVLIDLVPLIGPIVKLKVVPAPEAIIFGYGGGPPLLVVQQHFDALAHKIVGTPGPQTHTGKLLTIGLDHPACRSLHMHLQRSPFWHSISNLTSIICNGPLAERAIEHLSSIFGEPVGAFNTHSVLASHGKPVIGINYVLEANLTRGSRV